MLVLGNKRDLPNALDEKQLIEKMYVLRMNDGFFLFFCFLIGSILPTKCTIFLFCLALLHYLVMIIALFLGR